MLRRDPQPTAMRSRKTSHGRRRASNHLHFPCTPSNTSMRRTRGVGAGFGTRERNPSLARRYARQDASSDDCPAKNRPGVSPTRRAVLP
jgi:hypothetical protein